MGFLIYGSPLSPALYYTAGLHGLTHTYFEGSGHDAASGSVGGEVPKPLTDGKVQHDSVGDVGNVFHDGQSKGLK